MDGFEVSVRFGGGRRPGLSVRRTPSRRVRTIRAPGRDGRWPWSGPPEGTGDGGVREPRRPRPAPGVSGVALPVPPPSQLVELAATDDEPLDPVGSAGAD